MRPTNHIPENKSGLLEANVNSCRAVNRDGRVIELALNLGWKNPAVVAIKTNTTDNAKYISAIC